MDSQTTMLYFQGFHFSEPSCTLLDLSELTCIHLCFLVLVWICLHLSALCLHSFGLAWTCLHSVVLPCTRLDLHAFVCACLPSFGLIWTRLYSSGLVCIRLDLSVLAYPHLDSHRLVCIRLLACTRLNLSGPLV
ncbi:hypothetical protein BDR07DRAFT_1429475 [Suillus spraguei]|nr:hypothetical protein BDR07DRAFT_1429475 [Suillus spraguei]